MNVLFSLTPKSEVAYLYDDYSLRQALEKMEHYRYSAVPVIDRNGCYVGFPFRMWNADGKMNRSISTVRSKI